MGWEVTGEAKRNFLTRHSRSWSHRESDEVGISFSVSTVLTLRDNRLLHLPSGGEGESTHSKRFRNSSRRWQRVKCCAIMEMSAARPCSFWNALAESKSWNRALVSALGPGFTAGFLCSENSHALSISTSCSSVLLQRLLELLYSARDTRRLLARGGLNTGAPQTSFFIRAHPAGSSAWRSHPAPDHSELVASWIYGALPAAANLDDRLPRGPYWTTPMRSAFRPRRWFAAAHIAPSVIPTMSSSARNLLVVSHSGRPRLMLSLIPSTPRCLMANPHRRVEYCATSYLLADPEPYGNAPYWESVMIGRLSAVRIGPER